jgi:hypothetical protein
MPRGYPQPEATQDGTGHAGGADASHQVTYRPRTGQAKDALPFIRRVLKVELTYWPGASFRVRRYQQDVWYALHLSRMAQACHTRAPA